MQHDPLLLTIPQAAAALQVSRATVYRLTERGELPTVHIGRAVRIEAAALQRWIAAQSGAGARTPPMRGRDA